MSWHANVDRPVGNDDSDVIAGVPFCRPIFQLFIAASKSLSLSEKRVRRTPHTSIAAPGSDVALLLASSLHAPHWSILLQRRLAYPLASSLLVRLTTNTTQVYG